MATNPQGSAPYSFDIGAQKIIDKSFTELKNIISDFNEILLKPADLPPKTKGFFQNQVTQLQRIVEDKLLDAIELDQAMKKIRSDWEKHRASTKLKKQPGEGLINELTNIITIAKTFAPALQVVDNVLQNEAASVKVVSYRRDADSIAKLAIKNAEAQKQLLNASTENDRMELLREISKDIDIINSPIKAQLANIEEIKNKSNEINDKMTCLQTDTYGSVQQEQLKIGREAQELLVEKVRAVSKNDLLVFQAKVNDYTAKVETATANYKKSIGEYRTELNPINQEFNEAQQKFLDSCQTAIDLLNDVKTESATKFTNQKKALNTKTNNINDNLNDAQSSIEKKFHETKKEIIRDNQETLIMQIEETKVELNNLNKELEKRIDEKLRKDKKDKSTPYDMFVNEKLKNISTHLNELKQSYNQEVDRSFQSPANNQASKTEINDINLKLIANTQKDLQLSLFATQQQQKTDETKDDCMKLVTDANNELTPNGEFHKQAKLIQEQLNTVNQNLSKISQFDSDNSVTVKIKNKNIPITPRIDHVLNIINKKIDQINRAKENLKIKLKVDSIELSSLTQLDINNPKQGSPDETFKAAKSEHESLVNEVDHFDISDLDKCSLDDLDKKLHEMAKLDKEIIKAKKKITPILEDAKKINNKRMKANVEQAQIQPDLSQIQPDLSQTQPDLYRTNLTTILNEIKKHDFILHYGGTLVQELHKKTTDSAAFVYKEIQQFLNEHPGNTSINKEEYQNLINTLKIQLDGKTKRSRHIVKELYFFGGRDDSSANLHQKILSILNNESKPAINKKRQSS